MSAVKASKWALMRTASYCIHLYPSLSIYIHLYPMGVALNFEACAESKTVVLLETWRVMRVITFLENRTCWTCYKQVFAFYLYLYDIFHWHPKWQRVSNLSNHWNESESSFRAAASQSVYPLPFYNFSSIRVETCALMTSPAPALSVPWMMAPLRGLCKGVPLILARTSEQRRCIIQLAGNCFARESRGPGGLPEMKQHVDNGRYNKSTVIHSPSHTKKNTSSNLCEVLPIVCMPRLDLPNQIFSARRPHELPNAAVFIITAVLVARFGRGSIGVLDYGRHIKASCTCWDFCYFESNLIPSCIAIHP